MKCHLFYPFVLQKSSLSHQVKKRILSGRCNISKNSFFFLLSMRRLLDLVLRFLLFLYLKSWPDFLLLDLNTNFNGPDFPDHLSNLDPSQLYFFSSPVDAIAWMLHHYIKVMTKQSLSSLSFTNFFHSISHLETSLLVMATSSVSSHFICLISCCLSIFLFL